MTTSRDLSQARRRLRGDNTRAVGSSFGVGHHVPFWLSTDVGHAIRGIKGCKAKKHGVTMAIEVARSAGFS